MFIKIALSLLLCSVALSSATSYDGYKIYDILGSNPFEKEVLLRMSTNEQYDFFSLPRKLGEVARVMVPPENQPEFEKLLDRFSLRSMVINENVGDTVKMESDQNAYIRSTSGHSVISFARFNRFAEINAYLEDLAQRMPDRVSLKTWGKSYEGRPLKTVTIGNGDGRPNKKAILVDAGIHAREWIAPAGALYIIHQLAENFEENRDLLDGYEWIILPVVNPDGYEYSHTTSRMWRKTRKPVTISCAGTDGNRNFDFHWGEMGASRISCADTFRGKSAFSEPETQVVRDIMHSVTGRGKMYLTLHSYGNYLLYPWGFTKALPKTWRDIHDVASVGAAAIKAVTGTHYTVGSSTNVLYAASGGSDDYALGMARIPVALTMELPAGGSGFDPSPGQILPFVEETWIGIRAMAERVMDRY